jgi:hypothetical protein
MSSRGKIMAKHNQPTSRSTHVAVLLSITLVVLAAASAWLLLQNQALEADYGALSARYADLNGSNAALQQDYFSLFTEYSALNSGYSRLQSEHASLESQYASLASENSLLSAMYSGLSSNVTQLESLLDSIWSFPEAIGRTLNEAEMLKVDWAVEDALGGETDPWEADKLIYAYINDNIAYERDIDMPYITNLTRSVSDGAEYVTGFSVNYTRDYMATPALTLYNGYGDCDDQSILGYAMIKYFERNVTGTQFDLYLALVTFENGAMHLCLIRPATDGYAFVFDPAGDYISPEYGSVNASKALQSLTEYSDYWIGNGGIREMSLYEVTDYSGNYTLAANGTLAEVAFFLS